MERFFLYLPSLDGAMEMMAMRKMMLVTSLRMTRCQYWVESPMNRQAKENVRVPPASIKVLCALKNLFIY